jgi:glycosyltransferase involved in cell wall biosynthesis
MPTVLLLGYGLDQPSFRHRMQTLVEPLESAGWRVQPERFPGGRYGLRTWERRGLLRAADVVILHQIKLSSLEARLLVSLTRRRIFDLDDAIYVRKPRRLGDPVGDSLWRRRKFAATCRYADVVVAGNEVLAAAARPATRPTPLRTPLSVVVLPTSIDASAYQATVASPADPPTVAWIGSPENLIYLEMIRPALARLSTLHPALTLRVICSAFPDWPEVRIERIPWSARTEAQALAGAHIGIMPLTDDEWSRGKCAFKLLQYMAASMPCVASPVGANTEAVIDGVTGFHARDHGQWEHALGRLIESPELRGRLGACGRGHVESRYALRAYRSDYAALLSRLAAP